MYRIGPLLPALLSIAVLASAGAAYSQRVGTTGAVKPSSTGTPPGGGSRTLELGADALAEPELAAHDLAHLPRHAACVRGLRSVEGDDHHRGAYENDVEDNERKRRW